MQVAQDGLDRLRRNNVPLYSGNELLFLLS